MNTRQMKVLGRNISPAIVKEIEKKLDGKTIKQRLWLEEYLKTGNSTDAAYNVYNCKNRIVACQIGNTNRKAVHISEILELIGLSDVNLAKTLIEGLQATYKGQPNYTIRHKYLDTALRVKGHLSANTNENNDSGIHINVQIYAPTHTNTPESAKNPYMHQEAILVK